MKVILKNNERYVCFSSNIENRRALQNVRQKGLSTQGTVAGYLIEIFVKIDQRYELFAKDSRPTTLQ